MGDTILVVDDCATTRKLVSLYLKSGGFDIICAEDGMDALEKLAMTPVSLVITDLNMPQMDGIELIQALKEDTSTRKMPIILLTTEMANKTDTGHRVFTSGASLYLNKPVPKSRLLAEVGKLIH